MSKFGRAFYTDEVASSTLGFVLIGNCYSDRTKIVILLRLGMENSGLGPGLAVPVPDPDVNLVFRIRI